MKNINKQEDMVRVLWEFAKALQKSTNKTASAVDRDGYETKMDMKVMREAMEAMANVFGLEIQEIQ